MELFKPSTAGRKEVWKGNSTALGKGGQRVGKEKYSATECWGPGDRESRAVGGYWTRGLGGRLGHKKARVKKRGIRDGTEGVCK